MPDDKPIALSIDSLTRQAGISRATVVRAIDAGTLKAHRVGRRVVIMADDARSWLTRKPVVRGAR